MVAAVSGISNGGGRWSVIGRTMHLKEVVVEFPERGGELSSRNRMVLNVFGIVCERKPRGEWSRGAPSFPYQNPSPQLFAQIFLLFRFLFLAFHLSLFLYLCLPLPSFFSLPTFLSLIYYFLSLFVTSLIIHLAPSPLLCLSAFPLSSLSPMPSSSSTVVQLMYFFNLFEFIQKIM